NKEKHDKGDKRQSGDVLDFMTRFYATVDATDDDYQNDVFPFQFSANDIALIRSKNEGETWTQQATVIATPDINSVVFTGGFTYDTEGNVTGGVGVPLRASSSSGGPAPSQVGSFAVNPTNGNLYAVWEDNRFSPLHLNNIALSTSRDGGHTWSE